MWGKEGGYDGAMQRVDVPNLSGCYSNRAAPPLNLISKGALLAPHSGRGCREMVSTLLKIEGLIALLFVPSVTGHISRVLSPA